MTVAGIDLSAIEFWGLPLPERSAAFAVLRAQGRPQFFTEPEAPFAVNPRGYYALVSHADVVEASKKTELFCSGQGATSIADLPAEFNEYFGSMINMDDPRHARLRRIVSRAFTPKMVRRFEEDRSEERRVGKECRCRWLVLHLMRNFTGSLAGD